MTLLFFYLFENERFIGQCTSPVVGKGGSGPMFLSHYSNDYSSDLQRLQKNLDRVCRDTNRISTPDDNEDEALYRAIFKNKGLRLEFLKQTHHCDNT